jgi:hypothetical protein
VSFIGFLSQFVFDDLNDSAAGRPMSAPKRQSDQERGGAGRASRGRPAAGRRAPGGARQQTRIGLTPIHEPQPTQGEGHQHPAREQFSDDAVLDCVNDYERQHDAEEDQ